MSTAYVQYIIEVESQWQIIWNLKTLMARHHGPIIVKRLFPGDSDNQMKKKMNQKFPNYLFGRNCIFMEFSKLKLNEMKIILSFSLRILIQCHCWKLNDDSNSTSVLPEEDNESNHSPKAFLLLSYNMLRSYLYLAMQVKGMQGLLADLTKWIDSFPR